MGATVCGWYSLSSLWLHHIYCDTRDYLCHQFINATNWSWKSMFSLHFLSFHYLYIIYPRWRCIRKYSSSLFEPGTFCRKNRYCLGYKMGVPGGKRVIPYCIFNHARYNISVTSSHILDKAQHTRQELY